jgi:hypothetical protein
MPVISRFFGIAILIYHNDHPPAHFHVRYGERRARFTIDTLVQLDGDISPRVRQLVIEWAQQHRSELAEDWSLAVSRQPLKPIEPLE